jgi:hypothetical protein
MLCIKCNNEHNGTFGSGKFCSRKCANSREFSEESKLKKSIANKGKPSGFAGKTFQKEVLSDLLEKRKEYWDNRGRLSEEHKRAGNKANVYAYRARKRNAIPDNADLDLIRKIYQFVPEGYQVDHRIALASGGLHHQDNLQYLPASENARKGKREFYDESKVIRWQDLIVGH